MSFRSAFDSSGGLLTCRHCFAADWLPKSLDLRCGLRSAVRDDLLEHLHALFEMGVAGGILRGFLGGEAGIDFELLLSEREEAFGHVDEEQRRDRDNDQQRKDITRPHYAFPPLSIVSASISLASFEGWSVTIRSIVSSRSFTDPSSARI